MKTLSFADPDEGKVNIVVKGAEVLIDVYEVQNHLHLISVEHQDKPAHDLWAAIIEYFVTLGIPRVSHFVAQQIQKAVADAAEELEKKAESATGLPAESRDGMDSTVSAGPSTS